MVWKKNSAGLKPLKKLLPTKPLASGPESNLGKCGNVL
jgi:hypothetical protein